MLRWADSIHKINFELVLGVHELNLLSNNDFLDKLGYYVIKFISTATNGKFEKYDIENGIFSRLQSNNNLDKDKYKLISLLRDKMWMSGDKFLTHDEVKALFTL
jgi:hypothetical protein